MSTGLDIGHFTSKVVTLSKEDSNITVATFEVGYTLNANSPVTQLITTPLAPGASTNIAFPSITVPSGTNSISFSALTAAG